MITEIVESGQVRRYHANPRMNVLGQTNADHSWGVAVLIMMLHPNPSLALITEAIFHDSGERWCGDLPHPFKVENPHVAERHRDAEEWVRDHKGIPRPELTDEDHIWLKLADRLEAQLYARLHKPLEFEAWGVQEDILNMSERLGIFTTVKEMLYG